MNSLENIITTQTMENKVLEMCFEWSKVFNHIDESMNIKNDLIVTFKNDYKMMFLHLYSTVETRLKQYPSKGDKKRLEIFKQRWEDVMISKINVEFTGPLKRSKAISIPERNHTRSKSWADISELSIDDTCDYIFKKGGKVGLRCGIEDCKRH